MSALWRVSLMLVLNRSLLNREYILVNVLKALASIISTCNLHVTFLSKITSRYFTLFTNWIFRPFNVRWDSGGRQLRENQILRVLSSLILIFQRSHQVSIDLRPRWNFLTTNPLAICRIQTGTKPRFQSTSIIAHGLLPRDPVHLWPLPRNGSTRCNIIAKHWHSDGIRAGLPKKWGYISGRGERFVSNPQRADRL
jgi:hypothetical protein